MILLNFSHPLTEEQTRQIEQLTGQTLQQVIQVSVQFDHQQPFTPQLDALMQHIPLNSADWQTAPLLVNLPALHVIAALLLAELHGRMGFFPAIVRMRPAAGALPARFEVAEILNLQAVRDQARENR